MSVDTALVQLALVFLPGILWASLHRRYGTRIKISNFDFLLQVFVFGVVAYAASFVCYWAAGSAHPLSSAIDDLGAATDVVLAPLDVLISIGVASALSVLFLYAENYKLLTRFLQAIGATKTFGDEDVWDFTFNSSLPAFEYAQVRDHTRSLVFSGWVLTYSGSGETRELVLQRAQVHDFDGTLLYEMPYVYLSRPIDDVQVDFPYRKPT